MVFVTFECVLLASERILTANMEREAIKSKLYMKSALISNFVFEKRLSQKRTVQSKSISRNLFDPGC